MKVLIVEDEPLAREGLCLLLQPERDIEIVGECDNGEAAVQAITQLQPELVLLDIHLPGLCGLEVIGTVGVDNMPLVIFLTAYDQHAVEAFRLHALDYVLKPVSEQRFRDSLQRARIALQQQQQHTRGQQLDRMLEQLSQKMAGPQPERLMIRTSGHVYFLKPTDISRVEAEGDYVMIHTNGQHHLVRETMKQMEERLLPHGFQRIHRSSLVNLNAIRELVTDDNGDYSVVLHDKTRLKLSRAYRDEVCDKLQYVTQRESRGG